jgi:hypothetical protein
MKRREFLQNAGGALALALTPGLVGCPTTGRPDLGALGDAEPADTAGLLRARAAAIREAAVSSPLSDFTEARGFERTLPGGVIAALWITSTFRDLPAKTRRSPEVQQWMLDEGPAVATAVFTLTEFLEDLMPEERAKLGQALRDDPSLAEAFTTGLAEGARDVGVESERPVQARVVADHVLWRMRHQSVDAVIDEYVDRVDRVCKRAGFDRSEWRTLLAEETDSWAALTPLSDPDNPEVIAAMRGVAPADLVSPIDPTGAHLGVVVQEETDRDGTLVCRVETDCPAHRSGLRAGDRILAVDGRPVQPTEFIALLSVRSPDDSVHLDLARGSERVAIEAGLLAGPGDRIQPNYAINGRRDDTTPAIRAAYKILGVGAKVFGVGAGLFVLGLLVMAAEGGPYGVGAGMTIIGGLIGMAGLSIMTIGLLVLLVAEIERSGRRKRLPEPEDEPPDDPDDL